MKGNIPMRKFLLIMSIVLCFALTLCLASCNEEEKTEGNGEDQNISEPATDDTVAEGAESKDEPAEEKEEETQPEEKVKEKLTTDLALSPYLVRAASEKNGLYGYVDVRTGQYAIQPQFTYGDITFDEDGWACVSTENGGTVINTSGEFLFELGEIEDKVNYEGDAIVVKKGDKCYLYHGADYVCELKCDDETLKLSPTSAFAKGYGYNSMYTPDRYIVVGASKPEKSGYAYYLWFDRDGKLLYKADKLGSFAGDETGYYHFADNQVTKIDLNGNVIEQIPTKSSVHNVSYDGDNWYAMIDGTVYTNGFTPVAVQVRFNPQDSFNVIAGDGILKINDMYLDSTYSRFYSFYIDDYSYGFQNGYAKVDDGGLGAWGGDFDGYIDTQGNPVYEITDKDNFDSYTSILPDGYFIFGNDNNRYGIMKLDGTVVIEPTYTSLYTRENGRHA